MKYNLIIENYGKIKSANISKKPLTLLVGDNNTGKSYLLSLIWALDTLEGDSKLLEKIKNSEASEAYLEIKRKLCDYIQNTQLDPDLELILGKEELETLTNEFMWNNKDEFVSNIFNDKNVEIGSLKIELEEGVFTNIVYEGKLEGIVRYTWDDKSRSVGVENLKDVGVEAFADFFIRRIVSWVLSKSNKKTVYLPAARTGFMLAKDVINRVGRQETFDVMGQKIGNQVSLQAFTKPIIGFLNTIEELSFDVGEKYEEIVEYIEKDIIHGEVKYSNIGKREIRYVPEGMSKSISLRTTSAVVTELVPLVLVMKHGTRVRAICYEEPEMCLHPKLQLKIARAIIKMVNSGMNIYATTHSDIILQHINNMCKAYDAKIPEKIMEEYTLQENDVLPASKVAIYQLNDEGAYSTVQEITYENSVFDVPTFRDSLMDILRITTDIQDYQE